MNYSSETHFFSLLWALTVALITSTVITLTPVSGARLLAPASNPNPVHTDHPTEPRFKRQVGLEGEFKREREITPTESKGHFSGKYVANQSMKKSSKAVLPQVEKHGNGSTTGLKQPLDDGDYPDYPSPYDQPPLYDPPPTYDPGYDPGYNPPGSTPQ